MNTFYKIDSTKVSHLEFLWWHKSPLVLISWINKWLRVPIPCSSDDPNTESTLPFVVEALPPDIATGFEPLANELAALGFFDPVYHVIYDSGLRTTICWATFRHESGNHFARIHQRMWQMAAKPNRGRFPMFFTAFTDGTFLVSSAGKPDMATPKTVQMNRLQGATTTRLWNRHQQLLAKVSERKLIAPVHSREDLVELTERHHILLRDFNLERGVFRPRTETEQAEADTFDQRVAEAKASGLENAEVLAELEKLQVQNSNWTATLPVLIVTLVLFALVAVARWHWKYTLLIIPVLLLHEGGHWLAMRIFGYRNLRMFFIPFFGAAVTGHNWNVPGWKKALVSLAGPLPGIGLGIFLGVAGLVWKMPLLVQAALVLVFINGFNLLPVLPLDGGRVMHTILFCRNRWLDVVFRVLTIGGLLLLCVAQLGRLFMYLAIIMAISLPVAFKLAQITDKLRKTPLPEPDPGEDRIPVPTAQAIITQVRNTFPKNISNKQIAQHTLNVFETLNAKPPGTLGTLGLIAVQGGTLFLVAVFGLVFYLGKLGGLGDFAVAALRQPQHNFACGSVEQWQGSDFIHDQAAPHNLLVATFKKHLPAASEFTQLTSQLPATSRLTLFGDSLLLSLPASDDAAREKWFMELQFATTNVFVAVSNQPVAMRFQCIAPTMLVASNLAQDLTGYLDTGAGMHLVPPWSPDYQLPAFAAKRQARQDWLNIGLAVSKAEMDPALTDYSRKIVRAETRGARLEAIRLQTAERELEQKLQDEIRDRLRATNAMASVLIDLNGTLAKIEYTNTTARAPILRQIAAQLGEVKYDGNNPAPGADSLGAVSGSANQHGLMIEISWLQFNDATAGLPALANWLCNQKCEGCKYDLFAGFSEGSDDE